MELKRILGKPVISCNRRTLPGIFSVWILKCGSFGSLLLHVAIGLDVVRVGGLLQLPVFDS